MLFLSTLFCVISRFKVSIGILAKNKMCIVVLTAKHRVGFKT